MKKPYCCPTCKGNKFVISTTQKSVYIALDDGKLYLVDATMTSNTNEMECIKCGKKIKFKEKDIDN